MTRIEDYTHDVGTHDRCGSVLEPMIKPQWFVAMDQLRKPAIEALKKGDFRFVPQRFDKMYLNWMEICTTGALAVSFGGATRFRPTTATHAAY